MIRKQVEFNQDDKENNLQRSKKAKFAPQSFPCREKHEPFRVLQMPHSSTFNLAINNLTLFKPVHEPKILLDGNEDSLDSMSSIGTDNVFRNERKTCYYSEETSSSGFSAASTFSSSPHSSQEQVVNNLVESVAVLKEPDVKSAENLINTTDISQQFYDLTQTELINYYIDHLNCDQDCKHHSDEIFITTTFNGNQTVQEIYNRSFLKLLYVVGEERNKTKSLCGELKSSVIEAKMDLKELSLVTKFVSKLTNLNDESLSQRFLNLIRVYGWDFFKDMLLNLIFVEKKKNVVKVILK